MDKKKLFIDIIPFTNYSLTESQDNKGILYLSGKYQQSGVKNENSRIYNKTIFEINLGNQNLMQKLKERGMLGELEHPEDGITKLPRVSHVVLELRLQENGEVWGKSEVFNTPYGLILIELANRKAKFGVSSRGKGTSQVKDGIEYVNDDFILETFDFVYSPSTIGAYPKAEFATQNQEKSIAKSDSNDLYRCESLLKIADIIPRLSNSKSKEKIEKQITVIESSDKSLRKICESLRSMLKEKRMAIQTDAATIPVSTASKLIKQVILEAEEMEKDKEEDEQELDSGDVKKEQEEPEVPEKQEQENEEMPVPAPKSEKKSLKRKRESEENPKEIASGDYSKTTQEEDDDGNADADAKVTSEENDEEVKDKVASESKKMKKLERLASKLSARNESLRKTVDKLREANKTLATRYEHSIEMISGLISFTEKKKVQERIDEIARQNKIDKKIFESCKNTQDVEKAFFIFKEGLKKSSAKTKTESGIRGKLNKDIPADKVEKIFTNDDFFARTLYESKNAEEDSSLDLAKMISKRNNWNV